ncbi:MAG: hypothetical protein ACLQGT_02765 [Terracidiphilus sp.]
MRLLAFGVSKLTLAARKCAYPLSLLSGAHFVLIQNAVDHAHPRSQLVPPDRPLSLITGGVEYPQQNRFQLFSIPLYARTNQFARS